MPKNPAYRVRKKRNSYSFDKIKRSKKARIVLTSVSLMALLIFSGLIIGSYIFYKSISINFVSAFSGATNSLSNRDIFTLVQLNVDSFAQRDVNIQEIRFYMFNKTTKKVLIYQVNPKVQVDIPGILAQEELANTFKLGMMDERSSLQDGIHLTVLSLSKVFGMPVDKFVIVNSPLHSKVNSAFEEGILGSLINFTSLEEIKTNIMTDLSIKDFFELQRFLSQLPEERIIKGTFYDKFLVDFHDLDIDIREFTSDNVLEREGLTVSVLNGSGKPGLAGYGTRLLENMNARVVSTGNSDVAYEKSYIITDNPASETVLWLKAAFGVSDVRVKNLVPDVREGELDRSDIVVIFGFDKANVLY